MTIEEIIEMNVKQYRKILESTWAAELARVKVMLADKPVEFQMNRAKAAFMENKKLVLKYKVN
jgi:hypothetical protein